MKRTAHCVCGALTVEVTGDPKLVLICHCEDCQRRTGAPFGTGAYFRKKRVSVSGESTEYARASDIGGFAIRSDIASMRHETQEVRLFRS